MVEKVFITADHIAALIELFRVGGPIVVVVIVHVAARHPKVKAAAEKLRRKS